MRLWHYRSRFLLIALLTLGIGSWLYLSRTTPNNNQVQPNPPNTPAPTLAAAEPSAPPIAITPSITPTLSTPSDTPVAPTPSLTPSATPSVAAKSSATPSATPAFVQYAAYFFTWYTESLDPRRVPIKPAYDPYITPDWMEREMRDMQRAGLDGLFHVQPFDAEVSMAAKVGAAAKQVGLKVGMFLDTNVAFVPAPRRDLNQDANRQYIVNLILAWYRLVPRETWITIDGRPVILTWTKDPFSPTSRYDQLWREVKAAFRQEFGVEPFLLVDESWGRISSRDGGVDGYTRYGVDGTTFSYAGPIAHAEPGYFIQGVFVRPRDPERFRRMLEVVPPNARLVLIESWNELYEGSMMARTASEGTLFMDIVREEKARHLQQLPRPTP